MSGPAYPRGAVLALLDTAFTPPTRAAWRARLAVPRVTVPVFFDAAAFEILRAVAARLIPAPDGIETDLAGGLDRRLAAEPGPGWRYDSLPPAGQAYSLGLAALDAFARAIAKKAFVTLVPDQQDALLREVQAGIAEPWDGPDQKRLFEALLVELTELHVAHPAVQDMMGVAASADAPGWLALGLDQREPREPAAQ